MCVRNGGYFPRMNSRGNPLTLVASQPDNTNSLKSGLYSQRIRSQREQALLEDLRLSPVEEVLGEVLVQELASLIVLAELLDNDLAQHGVSNRRGEARRQVGQRLRVSKQIESLSVSVQLNLERRLIGGEGGPIDEMSTNDGGRLARWAEIRRIALGGAFGVPPSAQIKAIELFLTMVKPRQPSPLDALTDEQLDAVLATTDERQEPEPEKSDPVDQGKPERERCLLVLHQIASGKRSDARSADRIAATKFLERLCPPERNPIWEHLEGMTDEELDREYEEWLPWINDFAERNRELMQRIEEDE